MTLQKKISSQHWLRVSLVLSLSLGGLAGCGTENTQSSSSLQARSASNLTFEDFSENGGESKIWSNSLLLAKVAEASKYETVAERRPKLNAIQLKEYEYINTDAETQALIAYNKDVIVIAMPGTLSVRDGFQDFQIRLTEAWDLGYDVHHGFYRKANTIDADVLKYLAKLKEIDQESGHKRKLWLTGHSQGGSALQILAMRLLQKGYRATGIVTFGSPKAGQDRFRVAYDSEFAGVTHRWINEDDPVPSLPVRDSWRHVGRQHFIDRDDDRIIYNDRKEREWSLIIKGFRHHEIAEYIELLNKYGPGS
jgi:hypothetical protein